MTGGLVVAAAAQVAEAAVVVATDDVVATDVDVELVAEAVGLVAASLEESI